MREGVAHKLHLQATTFSKDALMPKPNAPAIKRPSVRQVKRAAGIEEPQDAIQLLKSDHRKVEALFKSFKKAASDAEKNSLAKRICEALTVHARIEEEIFYPAFIEATGNVELHDEALVEHSAAKRLIEEIDGSAAGSPLFDARVNVLAEMIKHHVKEEERFNGMFMRARMARMDLRALGVLLEARQRELVRPAEKRRGKNSARHARGLHGSGCAGTGARAEAARAAHSVIARASCEEASARRGAAEPQRHRS